jgi:hypothetical protein
MSIEVSAGKVKDDELNVNIKKKKSRNESEREEFNRDEKTNSMVNDAKKDELEKKPKEEIIPYKIEDSSYQNKLLTALKKQNKLRPKYLFSQDFEDITENITKLEQKEKTKDEQDEEEDFRVFDIEKEEKAALTKYKESSSSGTTVLQDPYALFSGAEQVYIDQYYKISDLFVICPLYFNYRISLEYRVSGEKDEESKYEAYHLFTTKEITPICSHNFLSNQSRQIDINIFNYIVEPKDKEMQKFITIRKPCRCAFSCFCACCTRPIFEVVTPIEKLGKIIEIRTLCDPVLHVLDANDEIIYILSTKCCQYGYCLRDSFCDNRKCARCIFLIADKDNNCVGKILKDHRSGKRIQPDYDQMVITYPPEASCQEKILLMCASLAIEYLYFQNMTNYKRCNGIPKYLNIPPYQS